MAKLRVEWIVRGCAPGVRTIDSRFLFHWITGFTERFAGLLDRSAWIAALAAVSIKIVITLSIDTPSDWLSRQRCAGLRALTRSAAMYD